MNQLGRLLRNDWGRTSAQAKLNLYFVSLYALWTYDDRLHGWLGLVKGAGTGGEGTKGVGSQFSWLMGHFMVVCPCTCAPQFAAKIENVI